MKKKIIAVDIDDVLADMTGAVRLAVNNTHGVSLSDEDYRVRHDSYWGYYEHVWASSGITGVDFSDLDRKLHSDISYISPLSGSIAGISKLSSSYDVFAVTSRDPEFNNITTSWVKAHFPDIRGIRYARNDRLNNNNLTKGNICAELGAIYLVDDNLGHVQTAIDHNINGIVFGNYGWQHDIPVTAKRAKTWESVVKLLT